MHQIQGAEGNCGGENVKTELFKTITVDPEGNILFEKVKKFDPFIEGVELVDNVKESNVHTRVVTSIQIETENLLALQRIKFDFPNK